MSMMEWDGQEGIPYDEKTHGPLNFEDPAPKTFGQTVRAAWDRARAGENTSSLYSGYTNYEIAANDRYYYMNKAPAAARRAWKREQHRTALKNASVDAVIFTAKILKTFGL